jgi:hypothetical protein
MLRVAMRRRVGSWANIGQRKIQRLENMVGRVPSRVEASGWMSVATFMPVRHLALGFPPALR